MNRAARDAAAAGFPYAHIGADDIGFRPILDRIIARRDEAPEMAGSIHIPESAQKSTEMKAQTGVVLAVGPGANCEVPAERYHLGPADVMTDLGTLQHKALDFGNGPHWSMDVLPGDRIAFSRYTGGDVPGHPGCIILRETDVLAVLEGEFTPSITADPKPGRYVGIDKSVR